MLHSFPSNIEHCLQWARELLFEGEFVVNPEEVNQYIKNPNYLSSLTDMDRKKKLDILGSILLDKQNTFDECVVWARMLFEEYYVRRPAQLVHTYPVNSKVKKRKQIPCFFILLKMHFFRILLVNHSGRELVALLAPLLTIPRIPHIWTLLSPPLFCAPTSCV